MLEVVGIGKFKRGEYNGNQYSGFRLYVVDPDVEVAQGVATDIIWIGQRVKINFNPVVGDTVDVRYTRQGKVGEVVFIKHSDLNT